MTIGEIIVPAQIPRRRFHMNQSRGSAGPLPRLSRAGGPCIIAFAAMTLAAHLADAAPPSPTGCTTIGAGQALGAGQSFRSCDGRFTLAMQPDGNLVLYMGSRALWSTRTNGRGGTLAVMQTDGNFVVYDGHDKALWASGTNGNSGSTLAVQDDGNLVVYAPTGHHIWASNTVQPCPAGALGTSQGQCVPKPVSAICEKNGGPARGVDLALFGVSLHHNSAGQQPTLANVVGAAAGLRQTWNDPGSLVVVINAAVPNAGDMDPAGAFAGELSRQYGVQFQVLETGSALGTIVDGIIPTADPHEHMAVIAGSGWSLVSAKDTRYPQSVACCKTCQNGIPEGPTFSDFVIQRGPVRAHLFGIQTAGSVSNCAGQVLAREQLEYVVNAAQKTDGSEPAFIIGDLNGGGFPFVTPPTLDPLARWYTANQSCDNAPGTVWNGTGPQLPGNGVSIFQLAGASSLVPEGIVYTPGSRTDAFFLPGLSEGAPGVLFRVCGGANGSCCPTQVTGGNQCGAGLACRDNVCTYTTPPPPQCPANERCCAALPGGRCEKCVSARQACP
jgi:hypothetical protein